MQTESNPKLPILIYFTPDGWGEVRKFAEFYKTTYELPFNVSSALDGVENHFWRYTALMKLTQEMIPKLAEDEEELHKRGYSDAIRSKQLSAVLDTIFCELYSTVDCTRKVLSEIYKRYRGINVGKTHKLFENAENGKIEDKVPIEIRNALIEANKDWYPLLQGIRNAINHSNIGSCHLNGDKVSYFYPDSAKKPNNESVCEDIFQEVSNYATKVNMFLGVVFHSLNTTLNDTPTTQICGVFGGRFYQRIVSPHEARDFNSGLCESYKWFEQESNPTCPFVNTCGAYLRIKEKRAVDEQAT